MIKTYLITFLRKFRREKLFSLLNLSGLTVGLTTVLLIGLFIADEMSYDRFHSKSDDIYLAWNVQGTNKVTSDRLPYSMISQLSATIPDIEKIVNFNSRELMVKAGEKAFLRNEVAYVSSSIFEVFDFPMLYGESAKLDDPTSIFLTEEMAVKFFGDAVIAMGQTLEVNERDSYVVAGVMANIPSNSTIQFDMLINGEQVFKKNSAEDGEGGYFPTQNWFLMKPGFDKETVESSIEVIARGMPYGSRYESTQEAQNHFLLPIKDFHLKSNLEWSSSVRSDIRYIYLFGAIGILVLVIAVINYTNLATAQSIKRAKEVGLRKVIGASRGQVIRYYLLESFSLVFLSALLAFAITERALPWLNNLLNKSLTLEYFSLESIGIIFGTSLVIGLLSGVYPAFVLSSAKPLQALGANKKHSKNRMRKALIVTQFFIAQLLIIATVIIQQQLHYIQNKNLGYEREHLIQIELKGNVAEKVDVLKNDLQALSGVEMVSIGRNTLQRNNLSFLNQNSIGVEEPFESIFEYFIVDENFLETMGMELIDGGFVPGKNSFIINEAALEKFGWSTYEGKTIEIGGGQKFDVTGVMKDFHNESLKSLINPTGIINSTRNPKYAMVRVSLSNLQETVEAMSAIWDGLETGRPIEYTFADETFSKQYEVETRLGEMFLVSSGLAIFIAILGLVGLSTFTIEQRLKEISLRRVLGASYRQLFQLFAKSYVGLIFIGFIVAAPIVYYFTNDWLAQFVYRIEPSVMSFTSAILITLAISLVVIVLQLGKTKRINPAESLRNE